MIAFACLRKSERVFEFLRRTVRFCGEIDIFERKKDDNLASEIEEKIVQRSFDQTLLSQTRI
jgi:hypothetical protein